MIWVYVFISVFILIWTFFEHSSRQWTWGSQDWMFAFANIQHHQLCNSLPFSLCFTFKSKIPLLFSSKSEEWSSSWWKSFRNELSAWFAFFIIVFRLLWDIVNHRHEGNPSIEIFWLFADFWHELLDFLTELQCGESLENIPLKFHWLTINCVQSSVLLSSQTVFDYGKTDDFFISNQR